MKVFVVTDLEGVAGVSGFDVRDSKAPADVTLRASWSRLWAEEVNAALRGAVAAGAEQVVVLDNHGPGTTLPAEACDPRAQLVQGGGRPSWLAGLDDTFDALVVVGQHAMAGSSGHLRHTYSRRRLDWVGLDGVEIGEIGLIAAIAGEERVPLVYLSGDDAAVSEVELLVPGVVTHAVKRSLSRECAVSLPPAESRARIEAGVERALHERHRIAPHVAPTPCEVTMRYRRRSGWRAAARAVRGARGLRWRGGRQLRFRGETVRLAWDRAIGLHPSDQHPINQAR